MHRNLVQVIESKVQKAGITNIEDSTGAVLLNQEQQCLFSPIEVSFNNVPRHFLCYDGREGIATVASEQKQGLC